MPNADGIELLQQLEQSTESVGTSILMLSPADKHLFRRRSDAIHVGAFVEKPVSQSSLLNSIREAIGDVAVVRSPDQAIVAAPRSLNVLVAEDIPANQKVVSAILKKRGHNVTIAHNGREAIALNKRADFDVVLMDVQMPVLDGLQATKSIRELERDTDTKIPIIAMTAHAMRGDREACLAAGMNAYVPKPLDADLLLRTLEKLAAGQQSSTGQQLSLVTKSGTWRYRSRTVDPPGSPEPPSPPQDQKPVWHVDVALKRMGDDPVILGSMVDYFFEDSPGLMQQLEERLQADNPTEATRFAHSLKGLCANFEASTAVKVAKEIETMCRENELADANERLPRLRSELEALTAALEVWKSEQGT